MGFNLGAALGAAADSGVKTYERLNKEAREQKLFDAWQKEQDQKEALTQASADTYGQVGQNKYDNVEALLAQQPSGIPLAGDGQGQLGADGKPVPVQAIPTQPQAGTTAYTREQADDDFTKRAYGINFDMGRKAEREGLEINNARRVDMRGRKEDEFSVWHAKSVEQMQSDPDQFLEDNIHLYNNARKGTHLDDGLTGKVVKGADGSSSFVQIDAKGNVVSSTPVNPKNLEAVFEKIAFAKYMSLPGKYKEGMELGLKDREVKAKEALVPSEIAKNYASVTAAGAAATTAQAHAEYYKGLNEDRKAGNWLPTMYNPETGDVGYTNTKKPGEFNDVFGKPIADAAGFKPKEFKEPPMVTLAREYARDVVAEGKIDQATGKPYTMEGAKAAFYAEKNKANSPEGQADTGFLKLKEKLVAAGTTLPEQQAFAARYFEDLGIAPPAIRAAMQAGTNPTTGKPFTAQDIKELTAKYPVSARSIGFGGAKQAIPTGSGQAGSTTQSSAQALPAAKEDTTKYAREKSPRGTYTYTPSPRGLTKAQYAEIDAAQKK